jgi:WD40 repeat protein
MQHQSDIRAVRFGPKGTPLILTGSLDRTARLWDAATGRPIGPALTHTDAVLAVAFAPDGKSLVTGGRDTAARLWPVPQPVTGDAEQLMLEMQTTTGLELTPEGVIRVLELTEWQKQRERLAAMSKTADARR